MSRLADIAARAQAARRGPWTPEAYLVSGPVDGGHPNGEIIIRCEPYVSRHAGEIDKATAIFVAHSREDIPYLFARLRRASPCQGCVPSGSQAKDRARDQLGTVYSTSCEWCGGTGVRVDPTTTQLTDDARAEQETDAANDAAREDASDDPN